MGGGAGEAGGGGSDGGVVLPLYRNDKRVIIPLIRLT